MKKILILINILLGLTFADTLQEGYAYVISAIGIKNVEGNVVWQSGSSNQLADGTYKLAPQVIVYDGKTEYVGAATPFTGCLNGIYYNSTGAPDGACFAGGVATSSQNGLMSAADKTKLDSLEERFYTESEIDARLSALSGKLVDKIYPIGAIYISVSETSPATLFGGTWEQIKDTFLLSAGNTYTAGSTGGEAEHTLTVDEMPSHYHVGGMNIQGDSHWTGKLYNQHTVFSKVKYTFDSEASDFELGQIGYKPTDGNSVINHVTTLPTAPSSISGSSQSHNNMPPYLTVYMWKRTA